MLIPAVSLPGYHPVWGDRYNTLHEPGERGTLDLGPPSDPPLRSLIVSVEDGGHVGLIGLYAPGRHLFVHFAGFRVDDDDPRFAQLPPRVEESSVAQLTITIPPQYLAEAESFIAEGVDAVRVGPEISFTLPQRIQRRLE